MANNETFLDRLVLWFKNNKFFSVIIFLSLFIVAAANVINSLSSISEKGHEYFSHKSGSNTIPESAGIVIPGRVDGKKPVSGFATVVSKFGSKGIGPGSFTDGWLIAVNAKGQIYVGDRREGGRIQLLDPDGKYISEWNTPNKGYMFLAIAADRKDNVYAYNFNIYKFEGQTGRLLQTISNAGFVNDLKTNTDGSLVVASDTDLLFYDANGKLVRTIHNAILSHPDNDDPEGGSPAKSCDHIAIDGLGNIYVIQDDGHSIFKFSADGTFVNRFGSYGTGVGQFENGTRLAVDGKGRVYLSDMMTGILVFDADGRYITTFNKNNADGPVYGMIFNDDNQLLVASDDFVIKYKINDFP